MLRLIPAPLHRVLLRIAHRVRITWWRWRRPLTLGVSIIAHDEAGRILLIRQSYGSRGWNLPGGGLSPGEDPAKVAARELQEEVGCALIGLRLVAVRDEDLQGARNRVHLFAGQLAGTPRPDRREVLEARLFPPAELPHPLGRHTSDRLALFVD